MSRFSSSTRVSARVILGNLPLVLAALVLLALPSTLSAQLNTGRISGAITDQSGGAIAGATVTVTDVARGESRTLTSDSAGQYAAPNLTPGIYTIKSEFMGFQTVLRQNVEVTVGGDIRVDIQMQPGATTQTVTVTESIPVVNTTNAQTGGVLENKLLTDLPTIGRNYRWQQSLVPGILVYMGSSSTTFSVDVNGTVDGHATNSLVDGLYEQNYFTGEVTFGGAGEAGFTTILPLDSVQEINLTTNPKAEYGWVPGVTTSIGLKSGTNDLHGEAYAFGRDTSMTARNAFSFNSAGQPVEEPLAFEQFGGNVGGPIKKDKIFYFASYEGFRESATVATNLAPSTPTLAAGAGTSLSIPDAIGAINLAGHNALLSPLSLSLAGCNPAKITSAMTTGTEVVASGACNANQFGSQGLWNNPDLGLVPDNGRSDNGIIKFDYHINDHHALNGSWAYGNYYESAAGNSPTKITQSYWEEVLGVTGNMARIVEIWTPNSNWLNEARWGRDQSIRPVARAECAPGGNLSNPTGVGASTGGFGGPNYLTQYGLDSNAPGCGIPTISLSGVTAQLGFSNSRTDNEVDEQGADSLSYTHGSHQFKFGTDIRAISVVGAKTLDSQSGTIGFGASGDAAFSGATALEDFLAGVPSSEQIRSGSPVRSTQTFLVGLFAQDDWRIIPRVTLNLGLREELDGAPTSNTDNLGNFAPGTPSGLVALTQPFKNQWTTEPRVGIAWDITGKGTTTLRASGGTLHALITLMNFVSGGSTTASNYDNPPTGELMCPLAGCSSAGAVTAPGDGRSAFVSFIPQATGGVVTYDPIPWALSNQATNTLNPLFPSTIPAECGNGFPVNGAGTAVSASNPLNPAQCLMSGGDPNLSYYRYYFWNANFQHAFSNNLSLDVGYVGSRTNGIIQNINLNQAPTTDVTANATSSSEETRAPYYSQYPWFSTIWYQNPSLNDNFRSLQVYLIERPAHGLSFTANYTYSGNYENQGFLNYNDAVVGTAGPYGKNLYPAQNLGVTATYVIPGVKLPGQVLEGWTATIHISDISGVPQTLLDTTDDLTGAGSSTSVTAGTPWTLQGPAKPFNQVFGRAGNIPCYGVVGSKFAPSSSPTSDGCTPVSSVTAMPQACITGAEAEGSFAPGLTQGATGTGLAQLAAIGCYELNGSAIVPPSQGTYGTMLPDTIHSGGFSSFDASLSKDWKIKERFNAQFRVEAFNLLNRTIYSGASTFTNLGSPKQFGIASFTPDASHGDPLQGRGGPRYMQLGLKLSF